MHTRIALSTIFTSVLVVSIFFAGYWYTLQYLLAPQEQVHAEKQGISSLLVEQTITEIFASYTIPFSTVSYQQVVISPQIQHNIFADIKKAKIEMYEVHTNGHTQWHIYSVEKREFILEILDATTSPSPIASKTISSKSNASPSQNIHTASVPLTQNLPTEVAIVFTGIQKKNIDAVLQITHPINFAIVPTDPFALHQAHKIAQQFHEIVIDTRDLEHFYIDAVPYASGIIENSKNKTPAHWNHLVTNSIDNPNATLITEQQFTKDTRMQIQQKIVLIDISTIDPHDIVEWINEVSSQVHLRLLSEVI